MFIAMVVYLGNGVAEDAGKTLTVVAVILGSMVALGVTWAALYFGLADLRAGSGYVGKRDLVGRVATAPVSEVAEIRLFSIASEWSYRPLRAVVLTGRDGRALLRVHGFFWSVPQIEQPGRQISVPVAGSWDDVLTAVEAENAHPGSAAVVQRRPNAVNVVIGLVFLVGIIVAVILLQPR